MLRAEKGYLIVGQETDGTVTPQRPRDGLDRLEATKSIHRKALASADRTPRGRTASSWSALLPDDPSELLPEGAQLVDDPPHRSRCRWSAT